MDLLARIQHALIYIPETGRIHSRLTFPIVQAGSFADVGIRSGYRYVIIERTLYQAHRLAFVLNTGSWPLHTVDHINGNKLDNTWSNLRDVPLDVNKQNMRKATSLSSTGFLGVERSRDKYRARIRVAGVMMSIGTYTTPEAAHEAYIKAKRKLHTGNTL